LDRDFLARSYRTTLLLLALVVPFTLVYLGPRFALGVGAGAVLGVVNLRLIEELTVNLFRPAGARPARVAVAAVLKLALVYGVGLVFLVRGVGTPLSLAIGFPMVLAVIFFKAVGRLYLARAGAGPVGPQAAPGQGKEQR
jgi:hypothetical protein